MGIKKKYKSPSANITGLVERKVICVSFDSNHRTEIFSVENEETI